MAFQQLIAKKVKLNGLMGIQHHMLNRDRVKTNPDIDLTRSHLNYFIENLTAENLNSRVKARIKQLNLKKRPRSDAVGLEVLLSKRRRNLCSMLMLKLANIILPTLSISFKISTARRILCTVSAILTNPPPHSRRNCPHHSRWTPFCQIFILSKNA